MFFRERRSPGPGGKESAADDVLPEFDVGLMPLDRPAGKPRAACGRALLITRSTYQIQHEQTEESTSTLDVTSCGWRP
jgi:hypothetical protein